MFRYIYIIHMYICMYIHVLMRDEKEGRKKQARSNKQQGKATQPHPRQSLFLRKISCLRWDSEPMLLYTLDRALIFIINNVCSKYTHNLHILFCIPSHPADEMDVNIMPLLCIRAQNPSVFSPNKLPSSNRALANPRPQSAEYQPSGGP